MKNELILTKEDFKNTKILFEQEKISPINEETMFRAGLYCILSAAEQYKRQIQFYNTLLKENLDTPKNIRDSRQTLAEVLRNTRFPNTKTKRVYDFALWWPKSNLPRKLVEDIDNGRQYEFPLRNRLAEEAPGIWYKGASLFMIKCGYENVVPLDIWVIRVLKNLGYNIEVPDYKKRSGPKPKEYLKNEQQFIKIAKEQGVSTALLQFALWSRYSTWNKK
jgi:thermostable 8-oxoguanine DNA glycosylase